MTEESDLSFIENNYSDCLFCVPLVHLSVCDWKTKKKKIIELYKKIKLEYKDNIITNFYNDYKILNNDFSEIFKDEITKLNDVLSINQVSIKGSWFEISNKNNSHGIHNHGPFGYSAVCFVEFDKTVHEGTRFIAPFLNFVDGNILERVVDVDEGSIIFFPSAIAHYTRPNESKKKRVILSFNLNIIS